MKKRIFGKTINLEINNELYNPFLVDELKYYEDSNDKEDVIITFENTKIDLSTVILRNPSLFYECSDSIVLNINDFYIRIYKDSNPSIIKLYPKRTHHRTNRKKFASMDNKHPYEKVGQALHELVLVPLTFLFDDIAMIHCSAFEKNGNLFMLGGTGGVGKTSSIVKVGQMPNTNFLADDILIINTDKVFANYAYPKIYSYNTHDNTELRNKILEKEDLVGKLQWKYKNLRKYSVRRRVSPEVLYNVKKPLTQYNKKIYFILARGGFSEFGYEKIDNVSSVSNMTLDIIKNEYYNMIRYYNWHSYNSQLNNDEPMVDLNKQESNWMNIYNKFFEDTDTYIIKIPMDIKHELFQEKMLDLINSLS